MGYGVNYNDIGNLLPRLITNVWFNDNFEEKIMDIK